MLFECQGKINVAFESDAYLDKPDNLIIRLLFGFASASVTVTLMQNEA